MQNSSAAKKSQAYDTKSFLDRHKVPSHFRSQIGSTRLHVNRRGFGSYRVNEYDPQHKAALRAALENGCNLIETSSNYGLGSSERLIGDTIIELEQEGKINRNEIVIISKFGYCPKDTYKISLTQGLNPKHFRQIQDNCWYSLHPKFIEHQLTETLRNLRSESIEFYLLHNPEMAMLDENFDIYKTIAVAFDHLEKECKRGRIQHYGISSNHFWPKNSTTNFVSLDEILKIKKEGFACIQFPFNLYETMALKFSKGQQNLMNLCQKENIGIITNRPFNALHRNQLLRLTSFPKHDAVKIKGELHQQLSLTIDLEAKAPRSSNFPNSFRWAQFIRNNIENLSDLIAWQENLAHSILPAVRTEVRRLPQTETEFSIKYQNALQNLFDLITKDLETLSELKNMPLISKLHSYKNHFNPENSLSQMALAVYLGFPQINSVLIGMRKEKYVTDAMAKVAQMTQEDSIKVLAHLSEKYGV